MRPNINPSDPPPFHHIGEYVFQELCRDLFEVQDGIATCEIYGTRGYAQRGIDLLANCDDAVSTEVGQCKCYENFPPAEIVKASDEFLAHWDYWKNLNVRRFILFVACPLDKPQQQDEIQTQKARFNALGICYEVWSARTLLTYLRPHRAIVERHIHSEESVNNICGRPLATSPPTVLTTDGLQATLTLFSSRVETLSAELSHAHAEKLERIRELSREGKNGEAYRQARDLKHGKAWEGLDKSLQASILRVMASLALHTKGDFDEAHELRAQAVALDPKGDQSVLRSLMLYYEGNYEAALKEVHEPLNTNALNLKLGYFIETSRVDEALTVIHNPPSGIAPDADTQQLHALALLLKGNLIGAQKEIQNALTSRPTWHGVRYTAARIDYYSALSVVALPSRLGPWPETVPWPLVKRDSQSQQHLRNAEREFARLASDAEPENEQRKVFNVWRLACLANDVDRQEEAAEFCRERLAEDPADNRILMWALSRDYDVDLKASEEALEKYLGVSDDDESE
jgi:tetratricopeptide (TPR) repeat protein